MARKGDFKAPTEAFLTSKPLDIEPRVKDSIKDIQLPDGYRIAREPKTAHMTVLTRPRTRDAMKRIAKKKDISVNELINRMMDDLIEQEGEL